MIRIWGLKLGFAEIFLAALAVFVFLSVGIYYLTGTGNPPEIELRVQVRNKTVFLRVLRGKLNPHEWEYIVFNVKTNPPVNWVQGEVELKPGKEYPIAYNLKPGVYRIQLKHKPTNRVIFDSRVNYP